MSVSAPYEVIPLTPLRKVIAARMTEAKQTIPHFRVSTDIAVDSLLALRAACNSESSTQESAPQKISVNDLIIKACAMTLMEYPAINIQYVNNEIHQYQQADISVVMAVEGGLSTPVIRQANHQSIWEISAQVKSLAARAKANQLKMDEILGGSFSISNLGMYNIDQFDAIINPPQAAILAVSSAKPRFVVGGNGEPVVATLMRATLSLDHRVLDGTAGAEFLNALREKIENTDSLV